MAIGYSRCGNFGRSIGNNTYGAKATVSGLIVGVGGLKVVKSCS